MSLTIDSGSTIYYFKSNSEIKRIRIDGGDTQISYHAAENLDKFSVAALTRTSTVESGVFASQLDYAPKPPLTYSIEDIDCSASDEVASSARNSINKPRDISLRRATFDLLKVVKEKLKVAGREGGRKVRNTVRNLRKTSRAGPRN